MKKYISIAAATVFAVALVMASCKNSKDEVKEAREDVNDVKQEQIEAAADANAAKSDSVSDYAKLKAETNKLIADNKTRIAEFKVKLKTESAANQKKFQAQIDQLEAKNEVLQNDLDNWTEKRKVDWNAFKSRVQKSVDDINKDIDDYKEAHNY
ncbi:hypothetical protein [Flavobacterium sp. BFFFF1]|uniref:hypothetical protein n=1 Tax=Flavobacterium sp. BFFFF1 TaxID=2015557 RepID=UPI0025BD9595|nr:hypothetical protein [Flavobacterium sp. BFFFF1]